MASTSSISIPESARRLFETDEPATIVTINADGTPQVSMVWPELDQGEIVVAADNSYVKIRNLRRNPLVTIMINSRERTPKGLQHHLIVRGRASIEGPGIPDQYEALTTRLARRYFPDGPPPRRGLADGVIVRITPERIRGIGPWA